MKHCFVRTVRKIFVPALFVIVLMIMLCGCRDKILSSIGEYTCEEFYSAGEFQDFTFFGIYSVTDADFTDNGFFMPMSGERRELFFRHIDDFESWVNTYKENGEYRELTENYKFDKSDVTDDDHIYIYDDPEYPELGNYDIYFYDAETKRIYYFHNNI